MKGASVKKQRLVPRRSKAWYRDMVAFGLPDVVEVAWHDSFRSEGWEEVKVRLAESSSPANIRSVGYLIGDDDRNVRVGLSMSENTLVGSTITIPKHAIRSMTVLAKKGKR